MVISKNKGNSAACLSKKRFFNAIFRQQKVVWLRLLTEEELEQICTEYARLGFFGCVGFSWVWIMFPVGWNGIVFQEIAKRAVAWKQIVMPAYGFET